MDRIFQRPDIEEICTAAKKAITDTKDCIADIKQTAAAISAAAGSVPAEAKAGDLAGTAGSLPGKLEKDNYDVTKQKLTACHEKACSIIPAFDSQYAGEMEQITAATRKIKKVIEELQEFMLETPLTTPKNEFAALLKAREAKWKKTLESVEATLDETLANVKGAEKISTIFSHDPVNLGTGNFIYDKEDLKIDGSTPFIFRRFYNSRNRYAGALGADWNHNYEVSLTFKKSALSGEEEVTILLEDGKEETFLPVEKGTYTPGNQSLSILKKTEEGYSYTTLSGETYLFDEEGRYLRHEDNNGQGFTLFYEDGMPEGGEETEEKRPAEGKTPEGTKRPDTLCTSRGARPVRILKDTGESFALSYDEKGYLKSVTDHTGRTFAYEIKDGRLVGAVRPDGGASAYAYDGNGKLSAVTNPRGITTVENEFDEDCRTTLQKFPDGTTMSYEYDDDKKRVTLTERNGAKTIHIHDGQYRNIKNIYPDGEESFAYNSRNQKVKITDKLGNETRLSYDNRGNLTGVINPLGTKLSITYESHNRPTNIKLNGKEKQKNTFDGKGNLLETKDALGRKTSFTYNEKGLPETIQKPDGSAIRLTYDKKGNIETVTDAMGGTARYEYDALNRVIKVTDPEGSTASLSYDKAGNISAFTNGEGNVRTYEYNESGKVTKITDFDGSTVQRTYNVLNKPEAVTDQLGRTTKLQYDAMWNLARITLPDGSKTTYLYNENNRLTRIKDALGNTVRYTYDGNGNCLSREDQEGNLTRFTYDAAGRLTKAEGPEGAEMTYAYDEEGHVIKAEDALGNTVHMEYDEAGQLIKETNPMGDERLYTYTALGKAESITDEAGRKTTYAYFPGGQVKEVAHPDGTKEAYTYDAGGNVKTHTDRNGFTVRYAYDSLGRIIRMEGEGGERKEYTYDVLGNVTGVTDAYGNTTRYEYTLTGQLAKVTDALGNETEYTYDLNDRLAEIRQYGEAENGTDGQDRTGIQSGTDREHGDGRNAGALVKKAVPGMDTELMEAQKLNRQNRPCHVTCYQRNALGQVEAITDALGNTEHYTYDKKGQLLEKLDKEGYLTKYGYTAQGDVDHITYADGREVKLSYNPLRQLEEMEDWLGITRIENDPMGRALKVQYPDGKEVSYTYGKGGERTSITYPDGRTASYLYDSRLRLAGLKDGEDTISYGYDEKGRLSRKTFPNGMETTYAYDIRGQLMELTHRDKEGILDRYVYGYDLMGNKTSIEKQRRGLPEESGTYAYQYDAMGRLAGVSRDGQPLRTYEYDAFGNRSLLREGGRETIYAYNAMNQLIRKTDVMNEETYAYDKRGNLSLILENGDIKNRYLYGALNRLEQAVNGRGEAAAYEYNGLGHRVGKASGAMEGMAGMQNGPSDAILNRTDVMDPLSRLEEQAIRPETRIEYTIDLTRQYHNLLQKEEDGNTQSYLWDGNVAGMREDMGTASHYYFQDELGSPVRLMDKNGELTESYGYDEFGQELYRDREETAGRSMTGNIQPFGYTGYQYDKTAGTYYARAREYRAELGRFAAVDTIKGFTMVPYTLNEYGYCWGNPMVLVDLDGAWPTWEDVENVANNIIENINNWIDDNVGVTNATRVDENFGILGGYFLHSESPVDDKLVNITFENGVLQAVSLNFKAEIAGIEGSTSIGLSGNLIDATSDITWMSSNREHKIGYSWNLLGIGIEWGSGRKNNKNGSGIRFNLNPVDTIDYYSYTERVEDNKLVKTENGGYINLMKTVLVLSLVAAALVVIVKSAPAAIPALGVIAFIILNKKITTISCETEGA